MSGSVRVGAVAVVLFAGAATPLVAQEYYGDIRPVIEERCLGCHNEGGIAFSMEDAEETYERHRDVTRMVAGRRMPPWIAEAGHQEYVDDLSLDDETVERFRRWADSGFPKGSSEGHPARVSPPEPTFAADVAVEIMPGKSYLPDQSRSDDYRCFVVDWPGDSPGYVTGFRTLPGNHKVAHHTVVYAATPEMRARFHELTDGEEGLGYQCFGGALPDRLGNRSEREAYEASYPDGVRELNNNNFWLAHWAPGMFGQSFPEGTGIPVEPGSALIVQMHYYSEEAPGESDEGTVLEFTTTSNVDRPAFHLPQTNNRWLAGERNGSMVIPAGEKASYSQTETLENWTGYITAVTGVPQDEIKALEIHSANLHMHAIGHSGRIYLTDRNGRRETLLSVPHWNLHWQRDFTFAEPKVFAREDLERTHISVECVFENPKEETVYGGFGSDEEMCFNFSYIAVQRGEQATSR